MKAGSGGLDFSNSDDEADNKKDAGVEADESSGVGDSEAGSTTETPTTDVDPTPSAQQYPYFVRRTNVGDERNTTLHFPVRDEIAAAESEFRHQLAAELGTEEVAKTDVKEFALKFAFNHPEAVAELMEAEGYDVIS